MQEMSLSGNEGNGSHSLVAGDLESVGVDARAADKEG